MNSRGLLYLDTSAWIDVVKKYVEENVHFIPISKLGLQCKELSLGVSRTNFFELIRLKEPVISRLFSAESLAAFNESPLIGLEETSAVIENEVQCFLDGRSSTRSIFNETVTKLFETAKEKHTTNDFEWFASHRRIYDENIRRDRALDLSADIDELSALYRHDSFLSLHSKMQEIITTPIEELKELREQLSAKKDQLHNARGSKRTVPDEDKTVSQYVHNRIQRTLAHKFGPERVSAFFSNPRIQFPGNAELERNVRAMLSLTADRAKEITPGLYWNSKVTYFNQYYDKQGETGKLGDRNHATYIPYVDFFATADATLIKALSSTLKAAGTFPICSEKTIHIFRTSSAVGARR